MKVYTFIEAANEISTAIKKIPSEDLGKTTLKITLTLKGYGFAVDLYENGYVCYKNTLTNKYFFLAYHSLIAKALELVAAGKNDPFYELYNYEFYSDEEDDENDGGSEDSIDLESSLSNQIELSGTSTEEVT